MDFDLRLVFAAVPGAYVLVRHGVIEAATDTYLRLSGQPADRLLGQPLDTAASHRFIAASPAGDLYGLEAGETAQLTGALRARDEFLSIATHELKTPISAMLLRLQRLRRTLAREQHAAAADVDAVLTQLSRLTRLVDNLLDVGRLRNGRLQLELEHFDLCAMVHDVVERLRDLARMAGSEVNVVSPAEVQGEWDRLRLEQVLTNLLTNALKYGGGHPIDVSVRGGALAQLAVHDRGIGISPADHERIFERFERNTVEHASASLGLGLYIARELVRAHGGAIRVESALGKGATFIVDLPLHPPGSPQGRDDGKEG